MMKINSLLVGMILVAILTGCEKINELIVFNIKNETEVSIPSQGGINVPLIIRSPEVQTSSEQTFENNNTKAELVENAQLSELRLTIVSPENQNFNFLNEIKLFIKDSNGNETLLASRENIPEDGSMVLDLETTNTNLKPFIQQENYSIRTEVKTDQVINQEIKMKINMTFRIQAKIF